MNTVAMLMDRLSADESARVPMYDALAEWGTEGDWNRYLDAHPDDHEGRHRFGVWLCERGDEKGWGYVALAAWQVTATGYSGTGWSTRGNDFTPVTWSHWHTCDRYPLKFCDAVDTLPEDWLDLTERGENGPEMPFTKHRSRAACEDASALAFSKLPPERRAELLTGQPTGTPT